MRSKRVTENRRSLARLHDVAARAGVSTASVSRALNQPTLVSEDVRRRVEEAAEALGYIPNSFAQALASQRSRTIGAVIPSINNAIFARGIEAVQKRLGESGYSLLLATHEYDLAAELRQVRTMVARGVDAVLVVGVEHLPELSAFLGAKHVPYVCQGAFRADVPCVGFDNRRSMRRIADYVLDLGHRRVAMISGIQTDNDRVRDRVIGVRDALAGRDLTLPPRYLVESVYEIDAARQAARALLTLPERPTAIVCGNDVLAFGALFEAAALGLNVPGDISVTGFDDLDLARNLVPALTTIRVPVVDMGIGAAEHLLGRLAGASVPWASEIEVELVERQSTAPPRA